MLRCTGCSALLEPGTDVCPRCNTDVRGGVTSRAARMSLVLGVLGLAALPIILSIPAIALALYARREVARHPGMHGRDMAGWGLATGIVGVVLGLALVLMIVIGAISLGS